MSQSQVDMAVSPSTHLGSLGPPVSPRESPVRVLPPAPSKRHRPKSLNLNPQSPPSSKKKSKNADMALRIVSPGLPILNEEMETTVKISQKIELQQRHLIAARQAGGSISAGLSSVATPLGLVSTTVPTTSGSAPTPSVSANTSVDDSNSPPSQQKITHSSDDKLSAPASAKRLKRDNIPTPLSITPSTKLTQSHKPLIQSAPIRYTTRVPITARHSILPQQGRRYNPLPSAIPTTHNPYYSFQRRYRPFPNTQITYLALPGHLAQPIIPTTPYKRVRMAPPHTTTSPYFPRGIRRPILPNAPVQQPIQPAQQEGKPYYVTDIYHGDLMKVAPLQSQPLSAQRDFFESSSAKPTPTTSHKMIDEDRLPVSDEEVREMQEKYKRNSEEGRSEDSKAGEGRPYGYPSEFHSQYGSQYRPVKPDLRKDDDVEDHAIEKEQHDQKGKPEKSEKDKPEREKSPSASPSSSSKEEEGEDWLAKEKDKFLKICETSWDEFVASRKLASGW